MISNLFKDDTTDQQYKPFLAQNFLPSRAPAFCSRPTWFVNGCEKVVKIGKQVFNYIDYCEAYLGMDLGTYRTADALAPICKRIEKAFEDVEAYRESQASYS